jgi:hypothetical protein
MVQLQIQALLGISAEQYAEHVWDMGLRYAYHYTNEDDQAVRLMTQCKSYWSWWQNQFDLIDQRFLACYSSFRTPEAQQAMYQAWQYEHTPECLKAFPGALVMEETYARMIGEAFDELRDRRAV